WVGARGSWLVVSLPIIMRRLLVVCALSCAAVVSAQQDKALDAILDTYVRDGEVYYRALKSDRGRLDAFVNQLAGASLQGQSREEQIAFWINAYNALVLRTV